MGSNPILLTLVSDTSPLQGLHRGGVLELLHGGGTQLYIPGAVEHETRSSFDLIGGVKVPDLGLHPWIRTEPVGDQELADFGAVLVGPRRSTFQYTWSGLKLDRPELEVVILGRRLGTPVVVEDEVGLRCARAAGVAAVSVAMVLRELVRAGRLDLEDAGRRAKSILATSYLQQDLEWLSRGIDDF